MGRDRRVRTLSVAAGGLVASVVLAACTGDAPAAQPDPPEPSEPPTSQAPTDDPTDEPTDEPTLPPIAEPELPAAATKPTLKGAEAFVEYYVELMNYAKSTGDSSMLLTASRGCDGCNEYAELYTSTYARGGYYKGFDWRPTVRVVYDLRNVFLALTDISADGGVHRDSTSAVTEEFEPDEHQVRFSLRRIAQGWKITDFVSQG